MHRCFVHPAAWNESGLHPDAEEAHHLLRVLRVAAGEEVTAFDGVGRDVRARVERVSRETVRLEPLVPPQQHPKPRPALVPLQAIAKPHRMDWLVEKAAELGAAELQPLVTARVVGRWSEREASEKVERWRRIAISALKQCGGAWLPAIQPVQSLDAAFGAEKEAFDLLLVGALTADARSVREVLSAARTRAPARVGLLVGPEGDLTPEEMQCALEAGAIPVSFGREVLRVETAAIFGLSVLRYELG